MNIIKQVKSELKNLLKIRFIVVLGILVLLAGIVEPVISSVAERYYANKEDSYGTATYYWGEGQGDPLIIDGVEITTDNPFYYDIYQYSEDYVAMWGDSLNEQQTVYLQELVDMYLEHFLKYAQEITTYDDYRYNLVWQTVNLLPEIYALETNPENVQEFRTAIEYIAYIQESEAFFAMTEEEKAEKLEMNREILAMADEAILENNLSSYADCMIEFSYKDIQTYENAISVQEAAVIENPELEESASAEIERLEKQITMTLESTIPTWEYRKEHQVYPNSGDWRDTALNEIEYATYRLQEYSNIMTEEDFYNDNYNVQEYGDYASYKKTMENRTLAAQNDILVAQNSLDSGKPDMKFVKDGARYKVNSNLFYAIIVSTFGILIGGVLIANEFQMGTVRLLMIRPRTRGKIYGSKYLAGLAYIYIIYILGMVCNIIANGAIRGFADYANPNYTANGATNFWGMIIIRILVCSVSIIFSYSLAFALSSLIRNSAIAIALPSAGVFGGMLGVSLMAYSKYAKYLRFTPFPYLNFAGFYNEYSNINYMIGNGVEFSVSVGVIMLLTLSAVFFIVGMIFFKKTDITN